MPPRKAVRSLFDLTQQANCELVIASCKKIESRYPSANGLSFDVDGCQEEVQKLQDYLREKIIKPACWDAVLQAVTHHPKKREIRDQRILFSTFIYKDVDLKKLTIGYPIGDIGDDALTGMDVAMFRRRKHVDYWLKQVHNLTNLVEVNLSQVENEDVIVAFSRTCKELEVINLYHCPFESTLDKMGPCAKLRRLTCDKNEPLQIRMHGRSMAHAVKLFPNLEHVYFGASTENLASAIDDGLVIDRRLNLRTLDLNCMWIKPKHVRFIIDLCPELEKIDLCLSQSDEEEVFEMLVTSELRLKHVDMSISETYRELYRLFLECKGIYITSLRVHDSNPNGPQELLQMIKENCPNIESLTIGFDFPTKAPENQDMISLPTLRSLTIATYIVTSFRFNFLDECLRKFDNLKELTLCEISEESLMKIIDNNARMQQIATLRLWYQEQTFTEKLLRHIYNSCANLTLLKFEIPNFPSFDAETPFVKLRREIDADNVDFKMVSHFYPEHNDWSGQGIFMNRHVSRRSDVYNPYESETSGSECSADSSDCSSDSSECSTESSECSGD